MDVLAFISKYEAVLKERGIPKMVFYKACEVSDAAVSQWRKGKTKPSMATVVRISEWLGVPVGYLIGEVATIDGTFFSDGSGYGGGLASGAGFGDGTGYGGPSLNQKVSDNQTNEKEKSPVSTMADEANVDYLLSKMSLSELAELAVKVATEMKERGLE